MAPRIDQAEVVAITENGRRVGWWVPDGKPSRLEVEIEPDDELEDDGGSEVVLTTVTESDGPRWHTLWTSSHLGLQEFLGEIE
jgi:hypothetical protein